MDEDVLRLIILRRIHAVVTLLVSPGFFIPCRNALRRNIKAQVFIQERITKINMIQQHQRLRTERFVLEFIGNRQGLFPIDCLDPPAEYQVFSEESRLAHFTLYGKDKPVLLPVTVSAQMLCRGGPDPAVHGIVRAVYPAGRADILKA